MLKKPIKYKDLDGNEIEEVFYFHFSKAELTEMQFSQKGGLENYLNSIVAAEDSKEIVALLKDLIVKSIGRRSPDGKRFIKNQEIIDEFVQSDAYSELFMEFFTDENAGAAFVNGVIPQELAQEVAAQQAATKTQTVELPQPEDEGEKLLAQDRDLTSTEMGKLTQAQKLRAYEAKDRRRSAS